MRIQVLSYENAKALFNLRKEVFVNEQGFSAKEEIDFTDKFALHIACYDNDDVIACGRILIEGKIAHFCRICVKKQYRYIGIGTILCEFMIDYAKREKCEKIVLNSQIHAIPFYEKMGFIQGDEVMDAGIPHVRMMKPLSLLWE